MNDRYLDPPEPTAEEERLNFLYDEAEKCQKELRDIREEKELFEDFASTAKFLTFDVKDAVLDSYEDKIRRREEELDCLVPVLTENNLFFVRDSA